MAVWLCPAALRANADGGVKGDFAIDAVQGLVFLFEAVEKWEASVGS